MNLNIEIDEYIKKKHYRQINSVLLFKEEEMLIKRYYNGFHEESRNVIKSVAKSIMSIGVGIALDQGLLPSLDKPIYTFLPQFNECLEPLHKFITVRHLLTMTSGIYWSGGVHYHCPMMMQMRRSKNWITHIADCAVSNMPGTKYNYKEWDVILLAKILDVVCGDMFDFINDNLYHPLGIQSGRWYKSPCGTYYSVANGDEGECENASNLTALEMLKIGQLFLNGGTYNGNQIISKSYIEQAVAPSNCNSLYGLLWWCGEGWYGCRGYGGQSITVIPNKNAIVVTQATPSARGMGYDDVIWHCVDLIS